MAHSSRTTQSLDCYLLPAELRTVTDRTPLQNTKDKYKDDHLHLYQLMTPPCEWPPCKGLFGGSLDHMDQRPCECVVYACLAFPFPSPQAVRDHGPISGGEWPVEYIDVNESLTRLVGATGTKNPWSTTIPTIVCKGLYIMRSGEGGRRSDANTARGATSSPEVHDAIPSWG